MAKRKIVEKGRFGRSAETQRGIRIAEIIAKLAEVKSRRAAIVKENQDCMAQTEQLEIELANVCGHKEVEHAGFHLLRCEACGFEGSVFFFEEYAGYKRKVEPRGWIW